MVAVAETWCWIYIVPKYMFKEKKRPERRHQNYGIIKDKKRKTDIERKMYQSSRLNDAKRLFQGIKSVSFFHISAVHVCTGVSAYD